MLILVTCEFYTYSVLIPLDLTGGNQDIPGILQESGCSQHQRVLKFQLIDLFVTWCLFANKSAYLTIVFELSRYEEKRLAQAQVVMDRRLQLANEESRLANMLEYL
jgi:hypothetical protein